MCDVLNDKKPMTSLYLLTLYPDLPSAYRAINEVMSSGYSPRQIGSAVLASYREMARGHISDGTNHEINVYAGLLTSILNQWNSSGHVRVAGIGKLYVVGLLDDMVNENRSFRVSLDVIGLPTFFRQWTLESLRQGDILVTVRVSESDAEEVASVLCAYKPIDIEAQAQQWRLRGWQGFDAMADPYSVEEIVRKKRQYRAPVNNDAQDCPKRVLRRYHIQEAQES